MEGETGRRGAEELREEATRQQAFRVPTLVGVLLTFHKLRGNAAYCELATVVRVTIDEDDH